MGRDDYSQSSQLSTLVGKPVSRYTPLPKNTDTLKNLTEARAKPNNRYHYSIYPELESEYQASYSQLTNLDFYSPIITILGDNPYAHLINTPFTDPGITLDEGSTLVSNVSTVNTNVYGTFGITYVATDGINPDTTKVRTVKVGEFPVVTIDGDDPYTHERYDQYIDDGVTVDANSSVTSTTSSVNNTAIGTYTVNYTVSNQVFTTFHSRIVNVVDTVPPVVTILGDNPYTLERFDVYTDPGATGDLGSIVTTDLSNVQNTSIGSFVVVYNATDGNTAHDVAVTRTVNVVDTLPPVVTILGDNPYTLERFDVYTDRGATVDRGSILTTDLTAVDNTLAHGASFVVTYIGSDGNTAHDVTVTRIVNIEDTKPPQLTILGANPYPMQPYGYFPDLDPGVEVDLGTSYSINYSNINNNNVDAGFQTVVYTASDGVHPDVIKTRIVSVADTVSPVITIDGDNPYTLERYAEYVDEGATADIGSRIETTVSNVDNTTVGSYTVTYTATDDINPDTIAIRTVNVVDTTAPIVSLNGASTFTMERFDSWVDVDPGVTIDTNGTLVSVDTSNLDNTAQGTNYSVKYTAVDDHENTTEIIRNVIVADTVPPVVSLVNPNGSYVLERYGVWADIDPGVNIDEGSYVYQINVNNTATGIQSVEYIVRDGTNQTTVYRTIRVVDTTPPVITINEPNYIHEIYTQYQDPGATVDIGSILTTDTSNADVSNTTNIGTFDVVYSATDGNTAHDVTVIRTVTVGDGTPPVITLVNGDIGTPNYTVERGTTYTDPGATADTGETVIVNTSQLDMSTAGTYTVYYSATDASGNTGTASRTVIVEDTTAPVISLVDGDNQGSSTYTVERATTYTDPGASADTGETVTIDTSQLDMSTSGTYTVYYSATDASGNTGTASRVVIVRDTIAPVLSLIGSNPYIVERGTTYNDPGATADTGETVAVNTSQLNMSIIGNYIVYYSATDAAGNTGTAYRTVTVRDTIAPVISLTGSSTYTVERGTTYNDPGATTDTGEFVTMDTSQLDMSTSGTYTVYYSATDAGGNTGTASRTVIVEDTTAPVISLTGSSTYTVERATTYNDPGVTADTGETVTIDTSQLDMSTSGTYTVYYSATDAAGNTGTASRTVIVQDTTSPVITLSGNNPYVVERGTTYNDPGATADTGETVAVNTSQLNMSTIGSYVVYYSATDAAGNTGTATRTVTVQDTRAPVITLRGSNPYSIYINTTYSDPGAYTNTGETVSINSSQVNTRKYGNYTVYYSATDAAGNTGTKTRTVSVVAPPPPTYVQPPGDGCFMPSTPIKLGDGRSVYIGDLMVGDVLEGGITVNATLKIRNMHGLPFYRIPSKYGNFDIYVTGTHHIKHEGVFMKVEECELSHTSEMVSDVWICLITSNHNIPIGGHTFWDWADWCDVCCENTIPQQFFEREDRYNVL